VAIRSTRARRNGSPASATQRTPGGRSPALTVTFIAQPSSAVVADGGLIFVLTQQPAASGGRYGAENVDGRLTFWTKGNEATFETPNGVRRRCRLVTRSNSKA